VERGYEMFLTRMLKRLPLPLLFPLFRVREVGGEKDQGVFRRIWTQVWREQGYANEEEPLSEIEPHYDLLAPFSTDLLLFFLWIPIGTLRLVWSGEGVELPALTDFEITRGWERPLVEFTLLAVLEEWRFRIPSFLLYREGYHRAKGSGFDIVMAADRRVFRILRSLFPFEEIGEGRHYEGSMTFPAALDLEKARAAVRAKSLLMLLFFDPEEVRRLFVEWVQDLFAPPVPLPEER
jgi:hypothetical protein